MKLTNFRIISAVALLALGFAAPVQAQVVPAPVPPQVNQQGCPPQVTPSAQVLYGRYMRRFGPLGLQPAQQQRIESLVDGFSQTHPAGSPLDFMAMHQLRDEVHAVLTPQQLAMLEEERHPQPTQRRCP